MEKKKTLPLWGKLLIVLVSLLVLYLLIPKWSSLSCEFDNWEKTIHYNPTCRYSSEGGHRYSSLLKCKSNYFVCPEGLKCMPVVLSCGLGCRNNEETKEVQCLLVIK